MSLLIIIRWMNGFSERKLSKRKRVFEIDVRRNSYVIRVLNEYAQDLYTTYIIFTSQKQIAFMETIERIEC